MMRPPYRSSLFYTWERTGCAAALIHERDGAARDLQMYAVGEVAHLCLLEAALALSKDLNADTEKAMKARAKRCLHEMPPWEGEPKPPAGPAQAAEGLRLALNWLRSNEPPTGTPETGLAVEEDLKTPTEYNGPRAFWQALLDHWHIYMDFDEESDDLEDLVVLRLDDYKSAWPEKTALTLQRKGQAILAAAHAEAKGKKPDRLILRTLNLRTGRPYAVTIEEPEEALEEWRAELRWLIDGAAQVSGTVEENARPGPACERCPYFGACAPAREFVRVNSGIELEEAARLFPVYLRLLKSFRDRLNAALEDGPIELADGSSLVRGERTKRSVKPAAYEKLWAKFFTGQGDPEAAVRSLLRRLKLGVSNLKALAASAAPGDRKAWYDWIDGQVEASVGPFGIDIIHPPTRKTR